MWYNLNYHPGNSFSGLFLAKITMGIAFRNLRNKIPFPQTEMANSLSLSHVMYKMLSHSCISALLDQQHLTNLRVLSCGSKKNKRHQTLRLLVDRKDGGDQSSQNTSIS